MVSTMKVRVCFFQCTPRLTALFLTLRRKPRKLSRILGHWNSNCLCPD